MTNRLEDRIKGCIIGGAIGDALGMPVEGLSREKIKDRFGTVQYYLKAGSDHRLSYLKPGQYTDDTQLMLATIKAIVDHRYVSIDSFVEEYLTLLNPKLNLDKLRGQGRATYTALNNLAKGVDPKESGNKDSLGCGAVSRAMPMILYGNIITDIAREELVHNVILMTHSNKTAVGVAYKYADLIWDLIHGNIDIKNEELINNYFIENFSVHPHHNPETILFRSNMLKIVDSLHLPDEMVADEIGTEGVVSEVIPMAVYSFLKYHNDFYECVKHAVNLGGDTDTLGFFAGQMCGAYNGFSEIPNFLSGSLEKRDELLKYSKKFSHRLSYSKK